MDPKNVDMMKIFGDLRQSRWDAWAKMLEEMAAEGWTKLPLWAGEVPNYEPSHENQPDVPSLYMLPIKPGKGTFIICAGGGFMFKSWNEAKPVAEFFYDKDINVAVLDYRIQPYASDVAGEDGLRAVRYLRANAEKLDIPADKIAIGGFSAGGSLTSMVATRYDNGDPKAADPVERVSSRPDAALLLYGAGASIRLGGGAGLGFDNAKQNEAARSNTYKNLRFDSPPFFIFQTHKDNPAAAMKWGLECAERGIPFEVHTFHEGSHGNGLYDGKNETEDVPHTAHWAELAAEWLHDYGF